MTLNKILIMTPVVALALSAICGAQAIPLVTNGNFTTTTPNEFINMPGVAPTGWNYDGGPGGNTNLATVFTPGAADQFGALDINTQLYLWGPNNPGCPTFPNLCSNNGLPGQDPYALPGSNYFATDSDPGRSGALSQAVNVISGQGYVLSFDWAAAQLRNSPGNLWNGGTQSRWTVSLGTQVVVQTAYEQIPDHGFSGWLQETISFIYNGPTGSALLSFLADGSPLGLPPVALLGNVSLETSVPEPSTISLMFAGVLGLVTLRRRQKKRT